MYPDAAAARAAATATRDALAAVPGVTRVTAVNALPVLGDHGMIAITDRRSAVGARRADADGRRDRRARRRRPRRWASACAAAGGGPRARTNERGDQPDRRRCATSTASIARSAGTSRSRPATTRVVVSGGRRQSPTSPIPIAPQRPPPRVWIPMLPATRRMTLHRRGPRSGALAVRCPHVSRRRSRRGADREPADVHRGDAARRSRATTSSSACSAGSRWSRCCWRRAGLFGVVSYTSRSARRSSARAWRSAPARWDVVRLVARQSLGLAVIGLTVGLAGGVGVGFVMGACSIGTSPADPADAGER